MVHTKFHVPKKILIINRNGCHVTKTNFIHLSSLFPRWLQIKFGFEWPCGFREENFENNIHVYSPGAGADNPPQILKLGMQYREFEVY